MIFTPTIMIIIILLFFAGIILLEYAKERDTSKMKIKEESIKKFPHEIFPKLLFWENGDIVKERDYTNREIYLGIADEKIITKDKQNDVIRTYSATQAREYLINKEADKRFNIAEEKKVLKEISENMYNDFLKALKEENAKLLGEQNEI